MVFDHSKIPYTELAKSNQYVPFVGFAVGADVEPIKSDISTLALRTYALFAIPRKE